MHDDVLIEDLLEESRALQRVKDLIARWKKLEGNGANGVPSFTIAQLEEAING